MSRKRYTIDLVINAAQADRSAAAATANMKAVADAARLAARATTDAMAAAARAHAGAVASMAASQAAATRQAATSATAAANAHAAATQQMSAAYATAFQQITLNARVMQAQLQAAARGVNVTFGQVTGGLGRMNAGASAAAGSFGVLGSRVAALGALAAAANSAADAVERLASNRFDAARSLGGQEANLRDIASMQGRTGQTAAVNKDLLALRLQTHQTGAEAGDFVRSVLESAQSSVQQGKITDADLQRVIVETGKIQASKGIDPSAMGGLVAMQINQSRGPTNAATVIGGVGRQIKMLEATRGHVPTLVQQFTASAHMIDDTGAQFTPTGGAAVFSALAAADPARARTAFEHLGRALYSPDPDLAAHRRAIGINDDMGLEQRVGLELQAMARAERAAAAQGRGFNPTQHLIGAGFSNIQDRRSLEQLHQAARRGQLGFFQSMANGPAPTAEMQRDFAVFAASRPAMDARSEAMRDANDMATAGGLTGIVQSQREQAYLAMRGSSLIGSLLPRDYANFSTNPLRYLTDPIGGAAALWGWGQLNAMQISQGGLNASRVGVSAIPGANLVGQTIAAGGSVMFSSPDANARLDQVVRALDRVHRAILSRPVPTPPHVRP